MQHCTRLDHFTRCLVAAFFLAWSTVSADSQSDSKTFAKSVLDRTLGTRFIPNEVQVQTIVDAQTQDTHQLCYLYGGPPYSVTGAVGVFTSDRKLLDAVIVKGFHQYETNASVMVHGDSVVLRTLDASGTGFFKESFVVLTLKAGKLHKTFQCDGDGHSMYGEMYDQTVQLIFDNIYGDSTREIIRLVKINRYASSADQDSNKPNATKSSAEVYEFDKKTNTYFRAYD